MAGGFKNRIVEKVIEPILLFLESAHVAGGLLPQAEASDQVYCATSWGYSSAFYRVAPGICCELWRRGGVPAK
eukprot:15469495-Alexandrium_andersonii.AAC.1